MSKTQIGWVVVEEDTVFHNANFSCAAWWEDILVKAGKYPAYVYDAEEREETGKVDGYIGGVWADLDGTIVEDYFGSLYFGMPISDYDHKKNAGKKSSYRWMTYLYEMADRILRPENRFGTELQVRYELLDGYEARDYTFWRAYDNKEITTHGIFHKREAAVTA